MCIFKSFNRNILYIAAITALPAVKETLMRSEGVEGDNEQGVKWRCLLYTKSPFHYFSPVQ